MHPFRPQVIGDKWMLALQNHSTTKEVNQCVVCGESSDQVALHYARMLCNGCRAFFKRAIQGKVKTGECKAEGKCIVDANSRKSCKACRFEACVRAGVDASKVQHARESSLDTAIESASGTATGPSIPHVSLSPSLSQESLSSSRRPASQKNKTETPPQSQNQKPYPIYLHSNYTNQPMENNALNVIPNNSGLSSQLLFPPSDLHGNSASAFSKMATSGITFVSYPQTQSSYLLGSYLGNLQDFRQTPAAGGSLNLGHHAGQIGIGGIGQYPTLVPNILGQSFVPNGATAYNTAYSPNPELAFHRAMDAAKSYPSIASPYQIPNYSSRISHAPSASLPMLTANPGTTVKETWIEGNPTTTRDSTSRSPCENLTTETGCINSPSQITPPNVKQEKIPQQSTDVATITSGICSTNLSNAQNSPETKEPVVGPKKSSSFMIENILGSNSPPPSLLASQSMSLAETNKDYEALSILNKALADGKVKEMEPPTAMIKTNQTLSACGSYSTSSFKHDLDQEGNSSEELNVVDVTSSEESHHAHPHIEIEADVPRSHDNGYESHTPVTHQNKAASLAPVDLHKPSPYLLHEDNLAKIPLQAYSVNAPKSSPATKEELHSPKSFHEGEATQNKPEHRSPRQELFPLSDSASRVEREEQDSNDSSTDSVFWNSSESTPSKRSNRETPCNSASKSSPRKPVLCGPLRLSSPARSAKKNISTFEHYRKLEALSPNSKLLVSPSKRKNQQHANSENLNLTPQAAGTYKDKDSPSNRKCLEEIPENSQVEHAHLAVNANSELDTFKEPENSTVPFTSSIKRRSRCLAFSSSSDDDLPKPKPKRRPTPKRPRPKYTSTPLIPPTCQSRVPDKSFDFQDILHICGEFFQRELQCSENSSVSLSSSPPSTSQTSQPDGRKLSDNSSSLKHDSSLHTDAQISTESSSTSTSKSRSPSESRSQSPQPTTSLATTMTTTTTTTNITAAVATTTESSDKTGSGEGSADSGIASMLERSGVENSSAFLENIRSKVMADSTYTMEQFKQDVLKFHRLSSQAPTSRSDLDKQRGATAR